LDLSPLFPHLFSQIDVPEARTGSVRFGGAEMQTLFITASKGLYAFKMKVKGAARQ
jgi:gluconolactonase